MTDSTALTVIERAQVALQPAANDKQLTELAAASKSIATITNPDGYQQCHSARMALKNQRIAIEKIAKSAREDATAFSKAVIAEEKRLIGLIQPEESRLETIQNAWDAARATEKRAKEEAERARVQEIQRRLAKIQTLPELYTSAMAPDRLAEVITQLEGGLTFDYAEFTEEAEAGRQAALVALRKAHVEALERIERETAERQAREAEERRLAAERADQERVAAEARAAEEARLAEVRRRLDAEKAEQERQTAEHRAADEQRARERAEESRRAEIDRVNRETAMAEIQSIQHQLLIADTGRAPYCKGGDLESYDWVIQQTEAWPVAEERFGALTGTALAVKNTTLSQLRQRRTDLEKRLALEAEELRLATERADIERREREQRETEERQRREAAEDEARRIAAEQAERERQEAEAARQREVEERRQRARETPPPPMDIVKTVAAAYDVDLDIAMEWLTTLDFSKVDMEAAA